jgi:hypothetical protein
MTTPTPADALAARMAAIRAWAEPYLAAAQEGKGVLLIDAESLSYLLDALAASQAREAALRAALEEAGRLVLLDARPAALSVLLRAAIADEEAQDAKP